MVYRRSKTNIRRPVRRRRTTRKRVYKRKTMSRMRKSACVCPGELSPTSRFALAQLDPFEPRAQGAKVPDSNTIPSIANSDQDQVTLTSSATAGHLNAIAFWPSYGYATLVAGPGAGIVNWSISGAGARRNAAAIDTNIEAVRPVAHGIRVSSSTAPTTATGFVHIGLAVESRKTPTANVPDLPVSVNEMTGLAHYKRFTLASLTQSPITAINKWIDETAFRYDIPGAIPEYLTGNLGQSTLNFGQSWATIVVMVEGAEPSKAILGFEHILHTECIPKRGSFILGTQAAPNSPGTMSAVSTMQASTDFSHTEAEQESYVAGGLRELDRGARAAGTQVWENVAVPLLNRAGGYAFNTAFNMAAGALMGRGGLVGVNSNPNRAIAN